MRILMIVESPAKAKTISKYLSSIDPSNTYTVKASFGHVRDLDPKKLSIDLDGKSYHVNYIVSPSKAKIVKELEGEIKKCDMVYLASDNDREGESISWHLRELLVKGKDYKRVTFNEITKNALANAIASPRDIDLSLVDAQQARRVVDRIVGYKMSPLLWKQYTTGGSTALSAGRVQSAALKLIVDKENEVKKHVHQPQWTVEGNAVVDGTQMCVKLHNKNGTVRFDTIKAAESFLVGLRNTFKLDNVTLHTRREAPDAPFITSTLQQEAFNRHGFQASQTMKLAQELYEGGRITYMRTDSYNISDDAKAQIKSYIIQHHGPQNYNPDAKDGKKKVKGAQEAHEAIRPTNVDTGLEEIQAKHGSRHAKLYETIFKRTVASQMKSAVYEECHIKMRDSSMMKGSDHFEGKLEALVFPGWKLVYGFVADTTDMNATKERLSRPGTGVVCETLEGKNTWTAAPGRYNEPGIIKTMEKEGIGRPSTYAGILDKLYDKQYIVKQDTKGVELATTHLQWSGKKLGAVIKKTAKAVVNAEKARLVPTEIGIQVNSFLADKFPDIVDAKFTAGMETDLDKVAEGQKKYSHVVDEFWKRLKDRVETEEKTKKTKTKIETDKNKITVDGVDYTVRLGKFGALIEYGNKKYIGLKPYLGIVKKAYTEIDKSDIGFLVSMPRPVAGGYAELMYGKFGLYVVLKDKTSSSINNIWLKKQFPNPLDIVNITREQIDVLVANKSKAMERKKKKGTDVVKP